MAEYLWSWAQFDAMKERHDALDRGVSAHARRARRALYRGHSSDAVTVFRSDPDLLAADRPSAGRIRQRLTRSASSVIYSEEESNETVFADDGIRANRLCSRA